MARSSNIIFDILARDKTKTGIDRAKSSMKVASTAILASIGVLAASSVSQASNVEQAMGGMEAVFKGSADQMKVLADQAAQTVGLSKGEYAQLSTVLGAQLKNMGTSMDALGGQTNDLVGLGADLAAQFGTTTSEAVEALSSLLRGERDPIERYGVSINEAALKAKMAEMGLEGLSGEAEKNAKLQATLALLTQQTADAQGALSRESDTLAQKQQKASAQWANIQAQLGEELLPVVSAVAGAVERLTKWFQENRTVGTILVTAIAAIAAIMWVLTAAQWAWNVAMAANPIGLIILGIAALVAGLVWFFTKTETGQKIWAGFTDFLGRAWETIKAAFSAGWDAIKRYLGMAWDFIKKVWSFSPVGMVVTNWNKIVDFFKKLPGRISSAATGLWDGIKNSFKTAVNWLIRKWNDFKLELGGGEILGVKIPSIALNTPNIPYLASGGSITKGGLAVVGERGPEIVSLPTGSRVHPNGYAPAGMAGGGMTRIHPDDIDTIIVGLYRSIMGGAESAVASNERARLRVARGLA